MSYSLSAYASMFGDPVRVAAYERALIQTVRPGMTVVDLGTGAGFFALMACRLGARKVYAIETNDAIAVGPELARANGCADRIEFIQEDSARVTLPERVDVLLSDLRGMLPLHTRHVPSIVDARTRFLAPGGAQLPLRDVLVVAPVEAEETYAELRAPWGDKHPDLDLGAVERLLVHSWSRGRVPPEALLATPAPWATLDYRTITSPNVSGTVTFQVARAGTTHGLQLWFDAEIAEGIGFSTSPAQPPAVYGTAFLPLLEPTPVAVGDVITLRIDAHLIASDYVWRWRTRVAPAVGGPPRVSFDQSTFFASPLGPGALSARDARYRPTLGEDGQIARFVLEQFAEGTVLSAIARACAEKFPSRFGSETDALAHVGGLSARYGK